MKLNEIKCVLTTEERLDLVEYIIGKILGGLSSYSCIVLHQWVTENPFSVNRVAASLGTSREHLHRLLSSTINIYPLTERHRVNVRVFDMGNEYIKEKDDTPTNIKLRLFLPELLEYEPEVLAPGGGFWKSNYFGLHYRLEALEEIRERLIDQLNE